MPSSKDSYENNMVNEMILLDDRFAKEIKVAAEWQDNWGFLVRTQRYPPCRKNAAPCRGARS